MGCNQNRRLGRLALATDNNIANVVNAVRSRIDEITRGGVAACDIHIYFTLGGGTGSGIIVDVVAQIQKLLRNSSGYHDIFVQARGQSTQQC